eukprot:CCRYP_012238-RE/>CCRYP_012238-RE protein AED:0.28 eAED:0.28 QI:3109/0.8/0.66/1/0.2/0.16/6/0/74
METAMTVPKACLGKVIPGMNGIQCRGLYGGKEAWEEGGEVIVDEEENDEGETEEDYWEEDLSHGRALVVDEGGA